ncbi:protein translocase subunit SecF [Alicyclobacillus sendaiensis]|uniref:Protein-export membrane protein SecF n=1 Tax=Alicyclobacillus sendaiensis PA2 TaxID=3029425 RepID=A0ABT6XWJ4_ALISE|nr:protein translocase subunit SecF [Alicyclobacillus sendaiensis]MDI9259441.1 protein translocase subunit SecF [Alicyclobacillus sendaiensis PA2]
MKPRFDIIRASRWFFLLSGAITVAGVIVFALFGFNLSTDFKSGSEVQFELNQRVPEARVRQMFASIGLPLGDTSLTVGGIQQNVVMVTLPEQLTAKQISEIQAAEHRFFPDAKQDIQVTSVDPFVAEQTARKAVYAVLAAAACIVVYIAIRFEFRFAISGIIALLHDAFIVLAAFALLRREVDLTFVAALLTIVGYSINDTIVIFDRIRENLKIDKPETVDDLRAVVNKSLWQVMNRSIRTVLTVLIAAVILYFFGGISIRNFTFALIIGLVSGAYSSIFIASPIWVAWRSRSMKRGNRGDHAAPIPE